MNTDLITLVARNLDLPLNHVRAVASLLAGGATVPFISRYRKELTGNMDEVGIRDIQLEIARLTALDSRRETIRASLQERGVLTPELEERLAAATTASALEDIYLPFRPKKRTRAAAAREAGLEPLAKMLMGARGLADPRAAAARYVKEGVADAGAALGGALDIVAEWVSEDSRARSTLRRRYRREAIVTVSIVKGKETEAEAYRNYASFQQPLRNIASHRLLAIMRGENEGILKLSVRISDNEAIEEISSRIIPRESAAPTRRLLADAVADGYKRLLKPSIETEMWAEWKEQADRTAIGMFSDNLRQLLLAAPLRGRSVLAIDPGFRTGCKVVALDSSGRLLADAVIYPNEPRRDTVGAMRTLMQLINEYESEAIALGDRTASRETEAFLRGSGIADFCELFIVSENGASVYSASDLAREEFPDKDVTVRGAVSIGRRLIDPLAELVKIDPKSIGVGQYQHDVDQNALHEALDFTVMSCVNAVGVDLNTASARLLGYVSGIGRSMATGIVAFRDAHGRFSSRHALLDVPRLGKRTFEQAAGFLRIPSSANPLDNTGIHPESYHIVEKMAADLGVAVDALPANSALIDAIRPLDYAAFGEATVADILAELRKPGRDPRTEAANVEFDSTIHTIDDLRPGMVLTGKVNNITAFGAFVDIGIKENGLLHVSEMAERRVKSPAEVVKINQKVTVTVIDVDLDRHRISLSMKQPK